MTYVFPLVGSIKVSPGLILPLFSASSIILRAIRSLTLPPALKSSTFAYTLALIPRDWGILFSRTSGVWPISLVASTTPIPLACSPLAVVLSVVAMFDGADKEQSRSARIVNGVSCC